MIDLINRWQAIDALNHELNCGAVIDQCGLETAYELIINLPSAQPETTTMILGQDKDGIRLWYKCSNCGEPCVADDNYCSYCGRRFVNHG